MNQKKVCIVTAARSEYGLLRWVIDEVYKSSDLELQLVVTGGHLSEEQGCTYKAIEADDYPIVAKVDINVDSSTQVAICKTMATCLEKLADTFNRLHPDVLVVLGDRYELLPICSAALMLNIPIAHISGGDVTEGAIDNYVRNAVTMMSAIHFPGPQSSADNIKRMIGTDRHVYLVGEPGLENLKESSLMSRKELASDLELDINKRWALCTLHSETMEDVQQSILMARKMVDALLKLQDTEIIITYANADLGGSTMNLYYEEVGMQFNNVHVHKSLGQLRYNSMMTECWCVVGNSSSGIVEAPFIGKPVINIGNRQKGRYMSHNIINVPEYSNDEIEKALAQVDKHPTSPDFYWGDGNTSRVIVKHLKSFLYGN